MRQQVGHLLDQTGAVFLRTHARRSADNLAVAHDSGQLVLWFLRHSLAARTDCCTSHCGRFQATGLSAGKDALCGLESHATQPITERIEELANLVEQRTDQARRSLGLVEVGEGICNRLFDHVGLRHPHTTVTVGDVVLAHPFGLGLVLQHTPLFGCKRAEFFQGMDAFVTQGADRIVCIHRNRDDLLEVVAIGGLTVRGFDRLQDV